MRAKKKKINSGRHENAVGKISVYASGMEQPVENIVKRHTSSVPLNKEPIESPPVIYDLDKWCQIDYRYIEVLKSLYKNATMSVKLQDQETKLIRLQRGVRQSSSRTYRLKGRMPINNRPSPESDQNYIQYSTRKHNKREYNIVRSPNSSVETPEYGDDVVDNILSKPTRTRKMSIDQLISNDECEYSSDDDTDEFNINNMSEDVSPIFKHGQVNTKHRARSKAPESIHTKHKPYKDTQPFCKIILPTIIITIISILGALYYKIHGSEIMNHGYGGIHYQQKLEMIANKYGIQNEDLVLQLISGLDTIMKSNNTGSFIFAYRSDIPGFHERRFNNLVNEVADASALFMRNKKPIVLEKHDFVNVKSHSEIINKHRDTLEQNGIMIIKEMENIPSVVAMAFHYFCDEYDPLVKRSAIFFTLDLDKCETKDKRPTHDNIEQCLIYKWNKVPPDNMGPLLTRVVSVVLDLTHKLTPVR